MLFEIRNMKGVQPVQQMIDEFEVERMAKAMCEMLGQNPYAHVMVDQGADLTAGEAQMQFGAVSMAGVSVSIEQWRVYRPKIIEGIALRRVLEMSGNN